MSRYLLLMTWCAWWQNDQILQVRVTLILLWLDFNPSSKPLSNRLPQSKPEDCPISGWLLITHLKCQQSFSTSSSELEWRYDFQMVHSFTCEVSKASQNWGVVWWLIGCQHFHSPPWQPSVYCSTALVTILFISHFQMMTLQGDTLFAPTACFKRPWRRFHFIFTQFPSCSNQALHTTMSKTECSALDHHRSMRSWDYPRGRSLSAKMSLKFIKSGSPVRYSISHQTFHLCWYTGGPESGGHWWPAQPIGIVMLWCCVASSMLRLQGAAADQIWLLWWECAFAVCILLLGCTIAAVVAVLGHCHWDSTVVLGHC